MRFYLVAFIVLLSGANAMWQNSWIVGFACGKASENLYPQYGYWEATKRCMDRSYLATVAKCILTNTNGNSTEMGSAWDKFTNSYCEEDVSPTIYSNIFVVSLYPTNATVDQVRYKQAYVGQKNCLQQKGLALWLGCALVAYWFAIMSAFALRKGYKSLQWRLGDPNQATVRPSPLYRWFQKRIFIPLLGGRDFKHSYQFGWFSFSFATRTETIFIGVYCLFTFIFMVTPYSLVEYDPFYPSTWSQLMRYTSDRSGIMGTVQLPLMVLFAMRNNLLINLTGWSYATFNRYHRVLAIVSYALLIIHSIEKHVFSASYGASLTKYFYPLMYYRWGLAAMWLFCIMIITGALRKRFYRCFLWVHVPCAVVGIVCSIKHLDGIGYDEPLYACIAIWVADIVIRAIRVVFVNYSIFTKPLSGTHGTSYGTIKLFNSEFIKIVVSFPVRWKCRPGQYVYLHDRPFEFLAGHPFSVLGPSEDGLGLELVCRVRNGFTKTLRNKLLEANCSSTSPVTLPLYIEGPYGQTAPILSYQECLIIAGGVGVTGVIQYLHSVCRRREETGSQANQIYFIWVVQKLQDLSPFNEILNTLSQINGLDIQLWVRSEKVALRTYSSSKQEFSLLPHGKKFYELHNDTAFDDYYRQMMTTLSDKHSETAPLLTLDLDRDDLNEPGIPQQSYRHRGSRLSRFSRIYSNYWAIGSNSQNEDAEKAACLQSETRMTSDHLRQAGFLDEFPSDTESVTGSFDLSSFEKHNSLRFQSRLPQAANYIHLVHYGRPDLPSIIKDVFHKAMSSVAVLTCGPPSMMAEVSYTVSEHLDDVKFGKVGYFEEAFGW